MFLFDVAFIIRGGRRFAPISLISSRRPWWSTRPQRLGCSFSDARRGGWGLHSFHLYFWNDRWPFGVCSWSAGVVFKTVVGYFYSAVFLGILDCWLELLSYHFLQYKNKPAKCLPLYVETYIITDQVKIQCQAAYLPVCRRGSGQLMSFGVYIS